MSPICGVLGVFVGGSAGGSVGLPPGPPGPVGLQVQILASAPFPQQAEFIQYLVSPSIPSAHPDQFDQEALSVQPVVCVQLHPAVHPVAPWLHTGNDPQVVFGNVLQFVGGGCGHVIG